MGLSAASYARQLKLLLPRGVAWMLDASSSISKSLLAIADELARIDARGVDLINETDPRTADETIEQWEEMLGLPDEYVTAIPATLPERQIAVTQKYVSRGGQSEAFFIALALSMGYVVTISRTAMLRVPFRAGDRVTGLTSVFEFTLDVQPPTGDVLPQADFERVIEHATHSHVTVAFNYL